MKAKKPQPPTVTVKLGVKHPTDEVYSWVVRYNGDIVEAYPNTPNGKREALRKKDAVLGEWKRMQRMGAGREAQ